jgi:hypothetical protein
VDPAIVQVALFAGCVYNHLLKAIVFSGKLVAIFLQSFEFFAWFTTFP